jgi:hypothetical protein
LVHFFKEENVECSKIVYGSRVKNGRIFSLVYKKNFSNILRQATNANAEDSLIFSPSSLIYEHLLTCLHLFAPLVFVGLHDDVNHRSWVKAGGEIITIPETPQGRLDLTYLREQLGI